MTAGGLLISIGLSAQSVVVNKAYNNTSTLLGGSVNGQGDGVELLVLKDHTDLRNAYIKDFFNMAASSTALVEGGHFQFSNDPLWSDLRSGTTITLIRPATSSASNPIDPPALDVDASDYTIQMALTNSASAPYIKQITEYNSSLFNLQGTDGIVLKRGDSPLGYDDVIHFYFNNYGSNATLKAVIDAFTFPKMLLTTTLPGSTGTPGYSGFAYANNPSATTDPQLGLRDYTGVDGPSNDILATFVATASDSRTPAWGIGEPGNNRTFINYLRNAPHIESVVPEKVPNTSMVDFVLTFSKDVTGVDLSDFELTATESVAGVLVSVSGSGSVYRVRVNNTSPQRAEGDLGIIVKGSGTGITDGTNPIFEGFPYTVGNKFRVGPAKPVITAGQVFAVNVNAEPGTVIGIPAVTLSEEGQISGWEIIDGNAGGVFSIDENTGEISVAEGAVFDYDAVQKYSLIVVTRNYSVASDAQTITIELLKAPSAPVIEGAYNGVVATLKPQLSGTGKASSAVVLYVDGVALDVLIPTDQNGDWAYTFQSPLAVGTHTFYAESTKAGISSDPGGQTVVYTVMSGWTVLPHNIITPNNDGKNDTWKIENLVIYPDNEVIVYDKQGKVVFRQKNYQQDWNGTSGGQSLNTGTYYYQVDLGGGMKPLKGTLTIVRDR